MKNKLNRMFAFILTLIMCLSMINVPVFATSSVSGLTEKTVTITYSTPNAVPVKFKSQTSSGRNVPFAEITESSIGNFITDSYGDATVYLTYYGPMSSYYFTEKSVPIDSNNFKVSTNYYLVVVRGDGSVGYSPNQLNGFEGATQSPAPKYTVTVRVNLGYGEEFVESSLPDNCTYDSISNTLTWKIENVAFNTTGTITYTYKTADDSKEHTPIITSEVSNMNDIVPFTFTSGYLDPDPNVVREEGSYTVREANSPNTIPIDIRVTDKNGNPIPGAVIQFDLGYENKTTDSNGLVTFDVRYPDFDTEYSFRQISAPEGYTIDSQVHKFTINADGTLTGENGYSRDAIKYTGIFTFDLAKNYIDERAKFRAADKGGVWDEDARTVTWTVTDLNISEPAGPFYCFFYGERASTDAMLNFPGYGQGEVLWKGQYDLNPITITNEEERKYQLPDINIKWTDVQDFYFVTEDGFPVNEPMTLYVYKQNPGNPNYPFLTPSMCTEKHTDTNGFLRYSYNLSYLSYYATSYQAQLCLYYDKVNSDGELFNKAMDFSRYISDFTGKIKINGQEISFGPAVPSTFIITDKDSGKEITGHITTLTYSDYSFILSFDELDFNPTLEIELIDFADNTIGWIGETPYDQLDFQQSTTITGDSTDDVYVNFEHHMDDITVTVEGNGSSSSGSVPPTGNAGIPDWIYPMFVVGLLGLGYSLKKKKK